MSVAILVIPVTALAQEATMSGTVVDATGGVLPGVTITALHEASGNTFETITDERGAYRIPLRIGVYRLTAAIPGFATVTRTGLELLVGQQATINLQMSPSALEESVTVTAETPLVNVAQSRPGGNVDPRQMQELPVNGRNWQDLALLAPGVRVNSVTQVAVSGNGMQGNYHVNLDGQQVTQNTGGGLGAFGQPRFSRDAIAEFEFVSNRFAATQGRSAGVQVNAITKSGTNTFSGTASGYFRNDRFNASDFIQRRVLPYSDQQLSGTFGGPVLRDKFHFFVNYEYEREPQTLASSSPYPSFNVDLRSTRTVDMSGIRLDNQFSPQTRLSTRGTHYEEIIPNESAGGAIRHPSTGVNRKLSGDQIVFSLTQVLTNRTLNEIRAGWLGYTWRLRAELDVPNPVYQVPGLEDQVGPPVIQFRGYTIGAGNANMPERMGNNTWSVRDDFTQSYDLGGRHDLKLGGEYLFVDHYIYLCRFCMGVLDAQGGPIPSNVEALFPVWNDVSTWNIAALSPISRRFQMGIGNFQFYIPRHVGAFWLQDDWVVTPRLTLNLGVRYDLAKGMWAEDVELLPFVEAGREIDKDNIAPRVGAAFSLNDRTVIRGGFGKFFGDITDQPAHGLVGYVESYVPEINYDGRADFAINPFNGPTPSFEQIAATQCPVNRTPTCVRQSLPGHMIGPVNETNYSYQTSVGLQRQLGPAMAVEADYVYTGSRAEVYRHNINLTYNPVTGINYPFQDISRRPFPDWGVVEPYYPDGWSNYHALQMAFTKRFSNRWQASATYLLSSLKDGTPPPRTGLYDIVTFPVAADLGGEYGVAASDQRHRAVFNGIWDIGYGFQLSGVYFYGSGLVYSTNYGGDLRNYGTTQVGRLRPNGTIVPRNNFIGDPNHRVDLRVQRRFAFGSRVRVDGMLEVFNMFNRENYGSYTTQESSASYGRPSQNLNVAYQPRMLQLGFRLAF
jgi:hypothetical protein